MWLSLIWLGWDRCLPPSFEYCPKFIPSSTAFLAQRRPLLYWWVLRGFWGTNQCFKICCFGPVLALLMHSMHFLRSCRNSSVQKRSKKSRKIVPTMRPFAWGGGVETLFGRIPFEQHFSYAVTSLTPLWNIRGILFSLTESKQWTLYCSAVSVAVDIEQTEGNDPPFGC